MHALPRSAERLARWPKEGSCVSEIITSSAVLCWPDHLQYMTPIMTLAFIVDMSISVIVMHVL